MNILLVDDHQLFASGVKNLLEAGGIHVAGMARNGNEALEAARRLKPDIILMDIDMPVCDGLTAARLIKAEFPAIKIVMLTVSGDDESLFEAMRNGASGFLLKNLDADEFFACLEQLARGETVFSPGLADRMLREFMRSSGKQHAAESRQKVSNPLTPRQEEVLAFVACGMTYKDVATRMTISETTVKYHMNEILERLQLDNRAQAIAYISGAKMHLQSR
jgi:two-component system NarL family response regulator